MGYGDVMVMEKNNSINRCHSLVVRMSGWVSVDDKVCGVQVRGLSVTLMCCQHLSVREFKIRGIVGWVENAAVHRSCCLSSSCRHSWAFPSMLVWERPWRIQSELLMQWLFRHSSSVHHLTCVSWRREVLELFDPPSWGQTKPWVLFRNKLFWGEQIFLTAASLSSGPNPQIVPSSTDWPDTSSFPPH